MTKTDTLLTDQQKIDIQIFHHSIAFDSGFRNLSNFNRRFREHYHCSPREYRDGGNVNGQAAIPLQ